MAVTELPVDQRSAVLDLARDVVDTAAGRPQAFDRANDAGPAVLLGLLARAGVHHTEHALAGWLAAYLRRTRGLSLVGTGLAGLATGAWAALPMDPRLAGVAQHARERLIAAAPVGVPGPEVHWRDYDLLHGPAGVVLALAAAPDRHVDHVLAVADRLAAYCDTADLWRARVTAYGDDPKRRWNVGRVNLGLGHGAPAIAAALLAVLEIADRAHDRLAGALRRITRFLIEESYVDSRGVRTWAACSREGGRPPAGASPRQAWCYGTPGVAWVLWEAGRVLADQETLEFAAAAMESLCRAWDDGFHAQDGTPAESLAFCHGAAGVLAVASAFDLHAGLPAAARLRAHLRVRLVGRLDEVRELAGRDLNHLTGAAGILCVLLSDDGGDRTWLRPYALR